MVRRPAQDVYKRCEGIQSAPLWIEPDLISTPEELEDIADDDRLAIEELDSSLKHLKEIENSTEGTD